MAAEFRIVSSPVRLTPPLRLATLATVVTADVLARRARGVGQHVESVAGSQAGSLSSQYALERELAREGHDRTTIGREAFVERVHQLEADARQRAGALLAGLGVDADLDAGAIDSAAATLAARTAFVCLYEEGRLQRAERVVGTCPRCEAVIDAADGEPGQVEATRLRLRLPLAGDGDSWLEVAVVAPELLFGAVAVAVPEGSPWAGRDVVLPLVNRTVPVLVAPDAEEAELVVPAHDSGDLESVRHLGLPVVEVFGWDGVVVAEGALAGLTRYAAREAATKLLDDEEVLVGTEPALEAVTRCRWCGTVVVPRVGRHWFLDVADLEVAAADRIREGDVTFSNPADREALLARAGVGREWCLSRQVWAGQPVPVSICQDCGKVAVSVDVPESCGTCMGTVVADDSVLDARFVGMAWLLSTLGWPARGAAAIGGATTLLVAPSGVVRWALPMAAIGLRLTGSVPFAHLAVHQLTTPVDDRDPDLSPALEALISAEDCRVSRVSLVTGDLDFESARRFVDAVDALPSQPDGEIPPDLSALRTAVDAAYEAGAPDLAVALVAGALADGVPPGATSSIREMIAPVFGGDQS